MDIESFTKFGYINNQSNRSSKDLFPVTEIINIESDKLAEQKQFSKEELFFCYKILKRTLKALLNTEFTEFDALTTTNCCHGISLQTRFFLIQSKNINLNECLAEIKEKIFILEKSDDAKSYFKTYVPFCLIELSRLHILKIIKEEDYQRGGWKTDFQKLKEISPIGTKFTRKLVATLQTNFSNSVALNYEAYLNSLNLNLIMCNAPLLLWGKYVKESYIRTDKRGRKYASCLFSMQISLAHLIQSRAKIALVNDLKNECGEVRGRHIYIYEGNGHSSFTPISWENLESNLDESIIVFGGCNYSNIDESSLQSQMKPWLNQLQNLVLACDSYYPQFPKVSDDSNFDSSPIIPEEDLLKQTIHQHSDVVGVSINNSSLFCLSHIYTASAAQVINAATISDSSSLPLSFLCEVAKTKVDSL